MSEEVEVFKKNISDKLKEALSFEREGFSEPIQWIDGVGVSRVKEMPNEHASLYKIGILDKEFQQESSKKRVNLGVSYGKKVFEGISLGSERQDLFGPIDFDNNDDFLFDISNFKFYRKDKEISPEKLLSDLEELHLKPTKLAKGFFLRSKLWLWRAFLPGLVKVVDSILIAILWIISGETVKGDILNRLFRGRDTEKVREPIPTIEFADSKKMDFFGYKAKRWSVVAYCFAHLTAFFIFFSYSIQSPFIEAMLKNNFTALCYVVVSFAVTEAGIPMALRFLIEQMPRLYGNISFMRLKF